MRIIKPKALQKGDVIGIAAPASPPAMELRLEKGIRYLEQLGYRIELGPHLHRRHGYLAGTDVERAADIHALFLNPKVKAVFTARGGYGCMRILPLLDYNLIRRHPKILVGYSDITALQLALLAKTGIVTFSGPMVAVEMADGLSGKAEEQFWRSLTSTAAGSMLHVENKRVFQKGNATGRIIGGNLSIVAALVGTPYFPNVNNRILLLEEIGERPYRIDRMLQQLSLSGVLKKPRGVILGRFDDCRPERGKPSLTADRVFEETFQQMSFPVVGYLHYGHAKNSVTVPLGVRLRLDASNGTVELLERGVV